MYWSPARERLGDGLALEPRWPTRRSDCALRRVLAEVVRFFGGLNFTPARRAFDSPMAIACFVERAPCFPSRM
jgi:hypothetical protein